MTLPVLLSETNIREFLNSFDNVLTDCDGVLWATDTVIPGSDVTLKRLRDLGKRIFYITNNSTKTRKQVASHCRNLGFIASEEEIITTGFIVAQHLKNLDFQKKVYVVGMQGITEELEIESIPSCGIGTTISLDPEVGAVAVGYDPYFNLAKVMRAASYLLKPECLFLASNKDERFPIKNKDLIFPGCGVIVNAVEVASARSADVMGKPHRRMFSILRDKYNLDPQRTIMIGDRCDTDILFGKNCGFQTLVVLTGINSLQDMVRFAESPNLEDRKLLADYYLPALGHMINLLPPS